MALDLHIENNAICRSILKTISKLRDQISLKWQLTRAHSKFGGYSIEIIRQSKIRGPLKRSKRQLLTCWLWPQQLQPQPPRPKRQRRPQATTTVIAARPPKNLSTMTCPESCKLQQAVSVIQLMPHAAPPVLHRGIMCSNVPTTCVVIIKSHQPWLPTLQEKEKSAYVVGPC